MKNLIIRRTNFFFGGMISLQVSLLSVFLFAGCSDNPVSVKKDTAFSISDTMMKSLGFSDARISTVRAELRLSGKIVADENNVVRIFPLVSGITEKVLVHLGDYVTKGQTLAIIKSGEVAGYEKELIQAQSNSLIAKKNLAIAQDMLESKLTSEKELLVAKRESENAEAELQRIKDIYNIYQIGKNSDYIVQAPIEGFIIDKKINTGMEVRTDLSESVFVISQLQEMYMMANVYETDISKIRNGCKAYLTTIAYPDKKFYGRVTDVYNIIDPETHAMSCRIKIDSLNKNFLLKPDMFAVATLVYREKESAVVIPSSSLIFDKNKNFVMVYKGPKNIETRPVELRRNLADSAWISNGLIKGEKVISKNGLFIYDAVND